MKIAITGGTGFVGRSLTKKLIDDGHEVFILTRKLNNQAHDKQVTYIEWLNDGNKPEEKVEGIDCFINLAGESINNGRWTAEQKRKISDSRMIATKEVLRIIANLKKKPQSLINASAVGYYGVSRNQVFTEDVSNSGHDFLAKTVQQWEAEASRAEQLGCRTVYCRFGVILDKDAGALPQIAFPYQLFVGGTVGSGKQWLSWIHLEDVINAILYIIETNQIKGAVNFTAPNPVTMKEFGKTLGEVLHRPHWITAPEFALKIGLGEKSMLVLEGQKVLPEKLIASGYPFMFLDLKDALLNIYKK